MLINERRGAAGAVERAAYQTIWQAWVQCCVGVLWQAWKPDRTKAETETKLE